MELNGPIFFVVCSNNSAVNEKKILFSNRWKLFAYSPGRCSPKVPSWNDVEMNVGISEFPTMQHTEYGILGHSHEFEQC